MNGLLSGTPSTGVIRLTVGAFLLLLALAILTIFAPASADLRTLAGPILVLAAASFATALAGIPDPAPRHRWHRHDR